MESPIPRAQASGSILLNVAAYAGAVLVQACRANSVGEFGLRSFSQKDLELGPVSVVITNFFATRANWKQPAQGVNLGETRLKLSNEVLAFLLRSKPLLDVARDHGKPCRFA